MDLIFLRRQSDFESLPIPFRRITGELRCHRSDCHTGLFPTHAVDRTLVYIGRSYPIFRSAMLAGRVLVATPRQTKIRRKNGHLNKGNHEKNQHFAFLEMRSCVFLPRFASTVFHQKFNVFRKTFSFKKANFSLRANSQTTNII